MQVRQLGCVVLGLALVLSACSQSPEAKKANHQKQGLAYYDKEKYQEAIIEYKNVVQLDPKDADAHYRLALSYIKVGGLQNLQAAFGELTKSIELDPKNEDAQVKLGEMYLLGREPAKAKERAEIVLASAPQNKDGLILHGQSLIVQQQFQEGIAELKKAIAIDPKNIRVYLDLTRAYLQLKDQKSAEETLQQALLADPKSTDIRVALGDLKMMTGKIAEAEADYKQAVDMEPEKDALYYKLAGYYQLNKKWDQAEATYLQLTTKKPKDEGPQIVLGEYYKFSGQMDKALESFKKAHELNAKSEGARDRLIDHYLNTGKLDEAEKIVTALLEKNKKDLAGRYFTGRLNLAKGKTDEAIELFQGVIKDEPQSAPAHQYLGLAFAQKNDLSRARQELGEAVKAASNLPDVHTQLAAIHLTEGSNDLAIEEAQTALRQNQRDVKAATILGDAYLRKGDLAKGKETYEVIAKALPNAPFFLYRLGLIARAEKNDAKALTYFEDALKQNPNFLDPLVQIASIKQTQNKSKDARERVTKQLEAAPNNPMLYNLLGRLWLAEKNSGEAEKAYKKAIDINSALPVSYMNLAQLYIGSNRLDEAIKEYEVALEKNPKLLPARVLLGVIYEHRKELDKAKSQYLEALKIDPKFAPAANNLAWIMSEQGDNIDQALTYAQTAREQRPEDPNIADTIGWIYYKKNAYLKAVSFLKEAAEKLGDNPMVLYHYGMALAKNGDKASAKKTLEASLKLNQTYPGAEEAKKVLKEL